MRGIYRCFCNFKPSPGNKKNGELDAIGFWSQTFDSKPFIGYNVENLQWQQKTARSVDKNKYFETRIGSKENEKNTEKEATKNGEKKTIHKTR